MVHQLCWCCFPLSPDAGQAWLLQYICVLKEKHHRYTSSSQACNVWHQQSLRKCTGPKSIRSRLLALYRGPVVNWAGHDYVYM